MEQLGRWRNFISGVMIRRPTNQCKYSFYGYIRHTEQGMIVLVKDGTESPLDGNSVPEVNDLPPVRYILPYPNAAIQRSAGVYKNYYGYK